MRSLLMGDHSLSKHMEQLNLILKVELENRETQIQGAARITIDGSGYLVVHNAESGLCERVKVSEVRSLGIVPIRLSFRPAPIAHAA